MKGLIIDIGANVGDTSIEIFSQNDHCFIVGVEADDIFFDQCIKNIEINNLTDRFLGVQKFISTQVGSFVIEKDASASTGSIIEDNSIISQTNTLSFSELFSLIPSNISQNFDLLKIDTDGFDWDILNSFSAHARISSSIPQFIFFEMQTFQNNDDSKSLKRQETLDNYINALRKLQQLGYTYFTIFDNFGTYILTTDSLADILTLNEYVIRSQTRNSHSTIFYFDILAYNEQNRNLVLNKISEF